MENHPTLPSLNGFIKRKSPERCPSPLYSQDCPPEDALRTAKCLWECELLPSTMLAGSQRSSSPPNSWDCSKENSNVPQDHQAEELIDIKVEVIDEEEEKTFLRANLECKEEEAFNDDGSSKNLPTDKCRSLLNSPDCPVVDSSVPRNHQDENLIDIKPEANADNDEMNVSGDHLCKEEEIPVNIGPNRSSERNPPERCPSRLYSQDCPEEGLNVPQDHQVCIKVEIEEEEELPLTTDEIETAHDITTISLVFDMGRLITLMQNFPAIWDVNCSDYLKRSMRDKAWEGLASQIYGKQWRSVSIDMKKYLLDEIKRKWRSARDQFRKEYTATPKSGARGKRKRPYMYLQQLMYLATTMEPRSSADHLENVEEEGEDSVLASSPTEELQSETGENCEVISQGPASQTVPAVPRPRKLGRPTASARRQTEIQQQVLALLQQQTLPRDSAESFGQHVAMLLRTVPENLQLATQNYMLYLLELSLPPNSPYELHYTIDQYRCRQSRQQLATVPPPQPPSPPTPPR